MHSLLSDNWVIVNGIAKIVSVNYESQIRVNVLTRIKKPIEITSRIIIETDCMTYFCEDYIVGLEDNYGRRK